MKLDDLFRQGIYTDNKGRFRRVFAFYDGFDGERRVEYEKGYINLKGDWRRLGGPSNSCSKQSFGKWAKALVQHST